MLLRSSSTPVLGSLLCSISESPNHNPASHYETTVTTTKHHPPPTIPHHKKLSSNHTSGSLNFSRGSCNSSPISPSVSDFSGLDHHSLRGFRRAQSEGNLEGLAYASCDKNEEIHDLKPPKEFSRRPRGLMLETIPSFSFHNPKGSREDEEEEASDTEENEERFKPMTDGEFGSDTEEGMDFVKEMRAMNGIWNMRFGEETEMVGQRMHLAKGLGIDGGGGGIQGGGHSGGGGGSDDYNPVGYGGDGGDNQSVEEYFKRRVEENPGNPLFPRNYAQFLYQSKGDLKGAEEYFSRAILVDPKDGEILAQYAKIVWELYHDQDRALSYFERAVQASPQDSHVQAAYASFLWETEEDEGECSIPRDVDAVTQNFNQQGIASVV